MTTSTQKTLFASALSDQPEPGVGVSPEQGRQIFEFFKNCPAFRWSDVNNNCEDRAEAICRLLEEWKLPNYKGWVFGGCMFKNGTGHLTNNWKYHVAALLPVQESNEVKYYIIDPATSSKLETIEDWAGSVTEAPYTKYVIKQSDNYIFMPGFIQKYGWYTRNSQNYKWTMQGLAGINGLSSIGKAYLSFNKRKIQKAEDSFKAILKTRPDFLNLPVSEGVVIPERA